jgi:hypothetical protein
MSLCLAWWCIPVIPAIRRLIQKDLKFETSLGYITTSRPSSSYIGRLSQKNKTKQILPCGYLSLEILGDHFALKGNLKNQLTRQEKKQEKSGSCL